MNLKHKIIPALLLLIAIGLLVTVLSSCSVLIGLGQTNPNRKAPGALQKRWMKQNAHQNSQP